ncbi:MAG: hypothetical protein Q4C49_06795 [Bacillota bacterium]|nr:hypothetical protein [Bacillota bacterium]
MEPIEKIERLRESADVTFEEARKALEESNWDLLDAALLLEKQGKKVSPIHSTKSTDTSEIPPLPSVKKVVETNKQSYAQEEQIAQKIKKAILETWDIIRFNSIKLEKNGEELFCIPLFLVLIAFLLWWEILIIAFVVGLFFNIKYSFVGKDDLSRANDVLDKASDMANKVKDEFTK